jgi:hypothetical protein
MNPGPLPASKLPTAPCHAFDQDAALRPDPADLLADLLEDSTCVVSAT